MLQLVPLIPVSDLHGLPVAVLLGSSVLRPREVYCFNFPTDMEQPGDRAMEPQQQRSDKQTC